MNTEFIILSLAYCVFAWCLLKIASSKGDDERRAIQRQAERHDALRSVLLELLDRENRKQKAAIGMHKRMARIAQIMENIDKDRKEGNWPKLHLDLNLKDTNAEEDDE